MNYVKNVNNVIKVLYQFNINQTHKLFENANFVARFLFKVFKLEMI